MNLNLTWDLEREISDRILDKLPMILPTEELNR